MNRKQIGVLAGVAVVAAAGLGAGIGIAATGSPTRPAASASAPAGPGYSWMPMMSSRPAFTGSALWFLGNPAPAGMHTGTLRFTAATPGTYRYLCPVPGHAQQGLTGTLTVRTAP